MKIEVKGSATTFYVQAHRSNDKEDYAQDVVSRIERALKGVLPAQTFGASVGGFDDASDQWEVPQPAGLALMKALGLSGAFRPATETKVLDAISKAGVVYATVKR